MRPIPQDLNMWGEPPQPSVKADRTTKWYLLSGSPDTSSTGKLSPEAALSKSETFGLLVWPGRLIRASALLIVLFELACVLRELFTHSTTIRFSVPIYLACLALGLILLAASFQPRLGESWQILAFALTSTVVALTTILGIATETAGQFFVDLLVLSLAASSLLPWKLGWQAAANALMLISLGTFAALAPTHDPMLYTHWVGLIAGAAVVQLCSTYGERYRQEIREQVNSLMQVANRLRQSEATLRRLFQVSCDAISVMRISDGRYLEINEEFLRQGGYIKEEIIGHSAQKAGPSIFRDRRFSTMLRNSGEIRNMDFVLERPDGPAGSALLSAVRVEIDNEPCVVTFARDITELKRSQLELIAAREAALAASDAKSEFLSSMSHEIRTPMNAVLGMADVLAETELSPEQRRYLNMIINNGTALLELINGILDVAKVESGRLSLETIEFSPREVAERVLETLAVRAHEKGLELVAQIAPNVPEIVVGDPLRLRQILINLVGNAVKFTEHGHVVINVAGEPTAASMLKFEVHDTGIGIPADQIQALFQPFMQGDSSTSRKYGGSGLGLAIVARLVALMGGKIKVESVPGSGSIFGFTARFAPTQVSSTAERSPDLSSCSVLVVDDSEPNREALKLLLSERGAAVTVATSGNEALDLIEQRAHLAAPFNAVLLDSSMPEPDGYEVAAQAAAGGHTLKRFIMMLPIDNPIGETNRLAMLGMHNYLVKPIKSNELFAAVCSAIGNGASLVRQADKSDRPATNLSPQNERMIRILFADDSEDNRALITAYMKNAPHLVEFAEDGQEAIRKFVTGHYDLVFMDIQMPIVDGYAAVNEIRQWESRIGQPPTPIVALTASAHEEAVRRAYEVGCDLHVSKPLKKRALLEMISRYALQAADGLCPSERNEECTSAARFP